MESDYKEKRRLIKLALKVSYYRRLAALSVPALADLAKVSVSTIQKLESPTNPRPVSLTTLWIISDVLGVHISKLFLDD